jgi:hypothetical protein
MPSHPGGRLVVAQALFKQPFLQRLPPLRRHHSQNRIGPCFAHVDSLFYVGGDRFLGAAFYFHAPILAALRQKRLSPGDKDRIFRLAAPAL